MSGQGSGTKHCVIEQCIWAVHPAQLLADAEAQSKPLDDAMVIDGPVKLVAGSSKHPNDVGIVNGELIY